MKGAWFYKLAVFAATLSVLDRASKSLALKLLSGTEGFLFKELLGFQLFENSKFAGTILLPKAFSLGISFAFLALLAALLLKELRRSKKVEAVCLAVALVGAGSNTADRLFYGHVIDFAVIGPWVINFSDIFIILGIISYIKTREEE